MKIVRLEVESFQGVPDGAYDFSRDAAVAPLSAVVGAPRSGRSGLLAAIVAAKEVVGPSGLPPSAERVMRQGASRGRLEALWQLEPAEAEEARASDTLVTTRWIFSAADATVDAPTGIRKLFAKFDRSAEVAKLELIPEELSTEASRQVPEAPALRSQRAAARADKYAWAPAALTQAMLGEAIAVRGKLREQGMVVEDEIGGSTEPFRRAMLAIAPHLRLGPLVDLGDGPEPTFASVNRPEGLRWPLLAGSDRRALALTSAAVHLGLARSIVLWDGPDRQFGGNCYPSILSAMKALLPHAQLIVAVDAAGQPPTGAHVVSLPAPPG